MTDAVKSRLRLIPAVTLILGLVMVLGPIGYWVYNIFSGKVVISLPLLLVPLCGVFAIRLGVVELRKKQEAGQ